MTVQAPTIFPTTARFSRLLGLLGLCSTLLGGCCAKEMFHREDSSQSPVVPAKEPPKAGAAPQAAKPAAPRRAPILSTPGKSVRVRFQKGETGTDIRDAVVRGERNRYLIGAMEGQTMNVTVTSPGNNATFVVVGADGQIIWGTEEKRALTRWSGVLPANGDTVISVGSTQGNAEFTLHVDVSPKNPAAQCKGNLANSELPCFLIDGRNGWCKSGVCKDVCPAGFSYHPLDTRCHQRRDCRSVADVDGATFQPSGQCTSCTNGHCFDPEASRELL